MTMLYYSLLFKPAPKTLNATNRKAAGTDIQPQIVGFRSPVGP